VTLRAKVTRAFSSSVEVRIEVDAEDVPAGEKIASNSAYFTFVAVDQSGKPIDVPELNLKLTKRKSITMEHFAEGNFD